MPEGPERHSDPALGRIAVYVATTAGPVRIELVEQDPDLEQSMVVLTRDWEALQEISGRYRSFVAGGGPVSRAYGPAGDVPFRLEVSGRITSGESWNLGVLVAHGLARAKRLAVPGEPVAQILLLTGNLDSQLGIKPDIEHLRDKLDSSRELVASAHRDATPIVFCLPNVTVQGAVPDGLELLRFDRAEPLLDRFAIPHITSGPPGGDESPRPRAASRPVLNGMAAVAVVASLVLAANVIPWDPDPPPPPAPDAPRIVVSELSAGDGTTCHALQYAAFDSTFDLGGGATADGFRRRLLQPGADGALPASSASAICGLSITLFPGAGATQTTGSLEVLSGRLVGQAAPIRSETFTVRTVWTYHVPRRPPEPIRYTVTARSESGSETRISHRVEP